jgi:serine kinase of HPr protein (carbohydrate metabolism regulator)
MSWGIQILIFETGELFSFLQNEDNNNSEIKIKNLMKFYQPHLILRRSSADSCEQYHYSQVSLCPASLLDNKPFHLQ